MDLKHLPLPTLYKLESLRSFKDTTCAPDVDQLSAYIKEHYDTFDEEELKKVALKCLTSNGLKHTILLYELTNYRDEPKPMSLDEFHVEACKLLQRYQHKAGGFMLEDIDWCIKRYPNQQYDMRKNEILFVNTINVTDTENTETDTYLDLLVDRLQSLTTNIELDLRYKRHHRCKTIHVLLWGSLVGGSENGGDEVQDDGNGVDDDPDIGL